MHRFLGSTGVIQQIGISLSDRIILHYTNMTSLLGVHQGKLNSPREDCRSGEHPTGMSYLFYYTEKMQNTKGEKITNRDFV